MNTRSNTLTGSAAMKNLSRLPGADASPPTLVNLQPVPRHPRRPGWSKSCTQELDAFPMLLLSMAALGEHPGRRDRKDEITTNQPKPVSPRAVSNKSAPAPLRNGKTNVAGGPDPVVQCSNLDFTPVHSQVTVRQHGVPKRASEPFGRDQAKGSNGCNQ